MTDEKTRQRLNKLKNTLGDTLDFLEESLREDLEQLREYKKMHGDLRYRPSLGPGQWGAATDTVLEPLASKYRVTVKTLVDTIAVIEGKIVGESENPGDKEDGMSMDPDASKKTWDAKEAMKQAKKAANSGTPDYEDLDD